MTTPIERQKARHILDRCKDIYRVAKRHFKDVRDAGLVALRQKTISTEGRLRMIVDGRAILNPERLRGESGGIAIVTEAFDCPGDVELRKAEEALEAEYLARMEALEKAYFEIRDRANLMTEHVDQHETIEMFEKFKADYYVPVAERSAGFGVPHYQE